MAILEAVGLTKNFGNLAAVNDFDLSIDEGELRGLIGPNGSGKTTLFNLITGFLRPTKGRIIWNGEDITRQSPHSRAEKGIVRTFQITTLFEDMTTIQNVISAHHLHLGIGLFQQFFRTRRTREKGKLIEQRALDILKTLGIADIKDALAGDLPHGHQRTLALAIAMAMKPKLLLLDEPVTGMNPIETREMMEKIRILNQNGATILLIEHDMRAVMGTCSKLTVMNFGQKIAEGTPEEIREDKNVVEAYLGRGRH